MDKVTILISQKDVSEQTFNNILDLSYTPNVDKIYVMGKSYTSHNPKVKTCEYKNSLAKSMAKYVWFIKDDFVFYPNILEELIFDAKRKTEPMGTEKCYFTTKKIFLKGFKKVISTSIIRKAAPVEEDKYKYVDEFVKLSKEKILNGDNWLYLDKRFYSKAYNISDEVVQHHKSIGIRHGYICNFKQILNIYPQAIIEKDSIHLNKKYTYSEFVSNFFDKQGALKKASFKLVESNLTQGKILLVITSYRQHMAIDIIKRFYANNKIDIAFCYVEGTDHRNAINIIKNLGVKYAIYTSKNFGTDTVPFNWVFEDIPKTYEYILKFHTKSNSEWLYRMIDCFCENLKGIFEFVEESKVELFCSKNILEKNDIFCHKILDERFDIKPYYYFPAGTIFLSTTKLLEEITSEVEWKTILNDSAKNMMYYDNYIFVDNSPVHSIERYIGYYPFSKGGYILSEKSKFAIIIACYCDTEAKKKVILKNKANILASCGKNETKFVILNCGPLPLEDQITCENNFFADIGMYYKGLKTLDLIYDSYIFLNDSFELLNEVPYFIEASKKMSQGMTSSIECRNHIQTFLFSVHKKDIHNFINFYNTTLPLIKSRNDLILKIEIATKEVICADVIWDFSYLKDSLVKNIHFNLPEYEKAVKQGYPILKLKTLDVVKYSQKEFKTRMVPEEDRESAMQNFNVHIYRLFNDDLKFFTDEGLRRHFENHGYNEGRIYKWDCESFDKDMYRKYNGDLSHVPDEELKAHFIMYGIPSGRRIDSRPTVRDEIIKLTRSVLG